MIIEVPQKDLLSLDNQQIWWIAGHFDDVFKQIR